MVKLKNMNKDLINSNCGCKKHMNLCNAVIVPQETIDSFIRFANEALCNQDFIECANSLLPFDGIAHMAMVISDSNIPIKSLGISLFRMDIEPSVFSLGITADSIISGENRKDALMVSACKTIEKIQQYVNEDAFRQDVIHSISYFMENQG